MTASTRRNAQPGPANPQRRPIGGRYRLAEPIGRGAMGVVWRARDELLDRDVAIKEVRLPPSLSEAERDNGYQRTLREARTAARLSHPAVAAVYDVVGEQGRPWIVMELIPGHSLEQAIARGGPLAPEHAAEVGRQLLAALAAAHAAGVLHRDVKPSNVLLGPGGRTVLTDFGIATIEGDPSLTQTGMVMGSPGFLAPERIRGGVATPASDLWSLGATLYAAVEGQGPYDYRGGALTTMAAVVTEDPPPPKSAGPLAALISALLDRDPAARPSAADAARMLTAAGGAVGSGAIGSGAIGSGAVGGGVGAAAPPAAPAAARRPNAELLPPPAAKPLTAGRAAAVALPSRPEAVALPSYPGAAGPPGGDIAAPPIARPPREDAARPPRGDIAAPPIARPPRGDAARPPRGDIAAPPIARPPREDAARPPRGIAGAQVGYPDTPVHGHRPARSRRKDRVLIVAAGGAAIFIVAAFIAAHAGGSAATPGRQALTPTAQAGSPGPNAPGGQGNRPGKGNGLPAGFRWYRQAPGAAGSGTAGFRVAIPVGWRVERKGKRTIITTPGSSPFLEVDLTPHQHAGMVAEALFLQRQTLRHGTFPGYQLTGIQPVAYLGTVAADWSFSWQTRSSGEVDVLDRVLVARSQGQRQSFALYWSAPAPQWQASLPVLHEVFATFQPVW